MIYYLGLGSNIGDRRKNLNRAISAIMEETGKVLAVSSFYETSPVGMPHADDFYNLALKLDSALEPAFLLAKTKRIEAWMGRDLVFGHYQPRIIDIDILLAGGQVIQSDCLQIPHPELEQRAFVLVPLLEIAPGLVHPRLHRRLHSFLGEIDSGQRIRRLME